MNPRTSAFDRLLTILVALVLILGGVWLTAWGLERLPAGWWAPTRFDLGLGDTTDSGWWPWALLIGGVLVTLIGILWLGSHFRTAGVGALVLPGGDPTGRLTIEASALTSGAAEALAQHPAVSSASGRLVEEKNRVVLALTATVSPQADLRAVASACDDVATHVLRSSGREDLACRVRVKVASRARSSPRVR
ncbi:MAG: hypothetical protein ACQERF_10630 [Actinomycetota bacterium]